MSHTVWKYQLPLTDQPIITVPKGAILISVRLQRGKPRAWFYVDADEKETEDAQFRILTTGNPAPSPEGMIGYEFVDTLIFDDRPPHPGLVMHVFVKVT